MTENNKLILKTYCDKIEKSCLNSLRIKNSLQGVILEAMEYSLMAGGKTP